MSEERQRGQSIIIVTLMLVALVVLAALAVDMSSAYLRRRISQNASDAAALAGGEELALQRNEFGKNIDKRGDSWLIKEKMNGLAERNDVEDTDPEAEEINANVQGFYLDPFGEVIRPFPLDGNDRPPDNAFGILARTIMTAPTYLGGVLGYDGYPLWTEAAVSIRAPVCGVTCVVPIAGFWQEEVREFEISEDPLWTSGPWGADTWPPPDQEGNPMDDFICYNIWNGEGPGNFGWLQWSLQDIYCDTDDCGEECLVDNLNPDNCMGYLGIGEWVAGGPGTVTSSGVREQLQRYIGHPADDEHEFQEPQPFVIPVYNETSEGGGCGQSYKVAGFAVMQLIGYNLSQGGGGDVLYDPWLVGDYPERLELCSDVNPWDPGDDPHDGERLTAYFKYMIDPDSLPGDCDPVGAITTIRLIR